ncbi:MAG: hypothetical protein WDN25_09010 [Acetobacteraceae bacterium]
MEARIALPEESAHVMNGILVAGRFAATADPAASLAKGIHRL